MSLQPRDAYLETQVLTATPQRLRLMLVQRALRDADLTDTLWREGNFEQAAEALIHCRDVIAELIGGIRPDASPLAQKVLGLYLFLFQALTEAQQSRDGAKLSVVRRILAAELETWQQVCQELTEAPAASLASAPAEIIAPAIQPSPAELGGAALSLEA